MPECCPQSPLFELYPGRPMEQTFSYSRDNVPHLPALRPLTPQIPHNITYPRTGTQPIKMAAVDPQLQIDYPEEWWNVPRENYSRVPGDAAADDDEEDEDTDELTDEDTDADTDEDIDAGTAYWPWAVVLVFLVAAVVLLGRRK